MAKTQLEKELEKQQRLMKKQQEEDKKRTRQEALRLRASTIVSGQSEINGMRILDATAEEVLKCLLQNCEIQSGNKIRYSEDVFPEYVQDSLSLELEKLIQYGMITSVSIWINGCGQLTLLPPAFTYFEDKDKAIEQNRQKEGGFTMSEKSTSKGNRVFIVHGHDETIKSQMARTLEKAGFEAIILHEQADGGRTIIEKIEAFTDVDFAVVLYTECDIGRSKNAPISDERFRARQNVVFEHGYLIAKLGRNKVCALVKGDVETPGDISGVVYTPIDDTETWKIQLFKNMKEAGLNVDMNKALL